MANPWLAQYAGPSPGLVDLPSYVSGYIDGEGCFYVAVTRRPTIAAGWEVRPSLSVSQNSDRAEVLEAIQQYFGCGSLRLGRSDKTLKWEVRSLPLLVGRIIPHFEQYPLLSGKRRDFEAFAGICEKMDAGMHRSPSGLSQIVRLASEMNPSGTRRYPLAKILREIRGEVKA